MEELGAGGRQVRAPFCLAVALLVSACAAPPAATVDPPSPSVQPSPTSAASASAVVAPKPLMPGRLITMPRPPDMVTIFSSGGQLYGRTTRDGPAPYSSKIVRADPATSTWHVVHQADAMIPIHGPRAGRVAMWEYREPVQGGGASSSVLVVFDLSTGKATAVDRHEMSRATFGGGGGPRRPSASVALGQRNIAWTRLIEGPGGVIEGELRVATLADPGRSTAVARSLVAVEPVWVDDAVLVYFVATGARGDIRELTLATGVDRLIASTSHWTDVKASGPWLGWQEVRTEGGQSTPTGSFIAIHRQTGERRTLPIPNCRVLTSNADFFAFACAANAGPATVLDWRRWELVPVVSVPPPVLMEASDGGLVWQAAYGGVGMVHALIYESRW